MKKFHITGSHPVLPTVLQILKEFDFIECKEQQDADILVVSCMSIRPVIVDKPTILLSTSSVYSCLNSDNRVVEEPFKEDQPLVIPSTSGCKAQATAIYNESCNQGYYPNNITLRFCNPFGLVYNKCQFSDTIIDTAKMMLLEKDRFYIHHSPYRKKSFIYKDDLEVLLDKIIQLFLEGMRGIYNVGSTETITVENAVTTMFHTLRPKTEVILDLPVIDVSRFCNFYEAVDITRIQAVTGWEPRISIRKGIWLYVNSK